MAIKTSEAPASALNALRAGLGQIRGVAEIQEPPAFAVVPGGEGQAGVPHEAFHLGLDAISSGRGLKGAEAIGWRYLLSSTAGQPAVAAEVHGLKGGPQYTFAGLNQGPFVAQTAEAIRVAGEAPEIRSGDFEPRLLRVPALYVVALWLKERKTGKDLLIPLEPSNPVLTPGRIYAAAEFEAALTKAAEEQRAAVPPGAEDRGPHAP